MVDDEKEELRLTLTEEDPLYNPFKSIKRSLGIKSNSEVLRFIIKQISNIPVSKLLEENLRASKKAKSTIKEGKNHE